MRRSTSAPYFSGQSVAHCRWYSAASASRMVRPASNSRLRSTNSTSGSPLDTLDQASAVGPSRSLTQSAGTASWGAVSPSSETSSPDIIVYARATAATFGAIGPRVSSDLLKGITPEMSMLPNAGLKPAAPQSEAGMRIDPPVSLPTAQSHSAAPTAAAEPPDEPPATRLG